jgi:hypothetical protein
MALIAQAQDSVVLELIFNRDGWEHLSHLEDQSLVMHFDLDRVNVLGLGIAAICSDEQHGPVFVSHVFEHGAASHSGWLRMGDQLLFVGHMDVRAYGNGKASPGSHLLIFFIQWTLHFPQHS